MNVNSSGLPAGAAGSRTSRRWKGKKPAIGSVLTDEELLAWEEDDHPSFGSRLPRDAAERLYEYYDEGSRNNKDGIEPWESLPPDDECPVFQYQPLEDPRRQIRLLRISQSQPFEPLMCTLLTCDLVKEVGKYVAMSYMWGADQPRKTIYIDGRPFQVGYNAWRALGQMKFNAVGEYYWMDQICINQHNVPEKNEQVKLMQSIYRNSWRVASCLGIQPNNDMPIDTATTRGLVETLREASSPTSRGQIVRARNYEALGQLSRNEYFRRLWIVQEVVLAPQIDMYVGLEAFPEQVIQSMQTGHDCQALFARRLQGTKEEGEDLPTLVLRYAQNKCGFPHDRIYALLSLCNNSASFIVDYERPLLQVLRDFLVHCGKLLNRPRSSSRQYSELFQSARLLCCDHFSKSKDFIEQARAFMALRNTSSSKWKLSLSRHPQPTAKSPIVFTHGRSVCITAEDTKISAPLRIDRAHAMELMRLQKQLARHQNSSEVKKALDAKTAEQQRDLAFLRQVIPQEPSSLQARHMSIGGVNVIAPHTTAVDDLVVEIGQRQHENDTTYQSTPIFTIVCRPSKKKTNSIRYEPIGWLVTPFSEALWLHRGPGELPSCHSYPCPSRRPKQLELHPDDLLQLILLQRLTLVSQPDPHWGATVTSAFVTAALPLTTSKTGSIVIDAAEEIERPVVPSSGLIPIRDDYG